MGKLNEEEGLTMLLLSRTSVLSEDVVHRAYAMDKGRIVAELEGESAAVPGSSRSTPGSVTDNVAQAKEAGDGSRPSNL